MNTLQMAEQMRVALQMFIGTLSDSEAAVVAEVYPKWEPDTEYKADAIRGYGTNSVGDTQLYRCIQAHKSQKDYPPPMAVSLWKIIGFDPSTGYPIWSQPVGAEDAYEKGDIVSHNGQLYISIYDGANVWEPGVYGWEVYDG